MIDANIISGLKPFQVESPVDNYSKMMTLQHLMSQNQASQMQMEDRQQAQASDRTLAQLMAQGRAPADIATGLASAGYGKQAIAYTKAQQDNAEGLAKIGHLTAQSGKLGEESLNLAIQRHKDQLGAINDPQTAAGWVKAGFENPKFSDYVKAGGRTVEQAIAAIPLDQAGFDNWKMQSSLGADKLIQMTRPDANAQLSAQTSLATNAATNLTSRDNNRATVGATVRGQNMTASTAAASRTQAENHFQAGQNAPQYMETDAGLVALPKKLSPGQVPVGVTVAGSDGQALGKPLKAIPASVNTAIIQNSQSVSQIDRALSLLKGVDQDGMKGDAAATGLKGYLPNGILNRFDAQGVDARAIISDIGSLKIHDRSGAAVTASESPRLMPFIPLATDDSATIMKKLNKLRVELAGESQAMQDVYSKDQGYKPSPVRAAPAAPVKDIHSQADAILGKK